MVHPDVEPYPQIAQAIQENWKRMGVDVSLKAVPYQELLEDYLEPRTYEAALVELNLARSPDPDLYPFWHQTQINGGQNYAGWDDRQASEYLEHARVKSEIDAARPALPELPVPLQPGITGSDIVLPRLLIQYR